MCIYVCRHVAGPGALQRRNIFQKVSGLRHARRSHCQGALYNCCKEAS